MNTSRAVAVVAAAALALTAAAARAASPVEDLKAWLAQPADKRPALDPQPFATAALSKDDAATAEQMLWADHVAEVKANQLQEIKDQSITLDGHTMKLLTAKFGTKPAGGWNLFISMHGGGSGPAAMNDQQWQNQIRLYQPPDSLVVAPRAPTNDWDLWHKDHIDPLFTRLVSDMIAIAGVNPNRVYIMGYSAGGDGVYQLAPRMADHWAAAAMMAGHPGDASALPLRDLPFALQVGALDSAYHRNEIAAQWGKKLDALQAADPKGYEHYVKVREGKPHWMDLEDAAAIPWMLQYTRNPLPDKVIWVQNDVTHDRFYYLATPKDEAKKGQMVEVSHAGQAFTVDKVGHGMKTLTIMLNDKLANLDQPVTITQDGKPLFTGKAKRTVAEMERTLADRGDPDLVFSATATVTLGE